MFNLKLINSWLGDSIPGRNVKPQVRVVQREPFKRQDEVWSGWAEETGHEQLHGEPASREEVLWVGW